MSERPVRWYTSPVNPAALRSMSPSSGMGACKLNISVPDGYMLQPDAVGDTGPSDLEKAVKDGKDTGFIKDAGDTSRLIQSL